MSFHVFVGFVHTISSSLSASITHCLYSVTLNHCSVHDLLLSVLTVSTLVGMFSVACESSASCSPLHLEKWVFLVLLCTNGSNLSHCWRNLISSGDYPHTVISLFLRSTPYVQNTHACSNYGNKKFVPGYGCKKTHRLTCKAIYVIMILTVTVVFFCFIFV